MDQKQVSTKKIKLTPEEIHNMLDNCPDNIRNYIHELEHRIQRHAEIGVALSKEKNMDELLEMILLEAKQIANADGGTLYMRTDDNRLKFEIMMTDSLNFHMGGTSGKPIPFYPVKLYNDDGSPNVNMIAAYVGLTGKTVNIKDAYQEEGFDFSGTKAFDSKTGYRSKSFLTVPLKNHEDEIIGVLQLLNSQHPRTGETIPFSGDVQSLVEGLASQAAVAITNKNLIKSLEVLFESFIKLIASAIDAKSKYTGGHCERVPVITMMLAEAVNKLDEGPFKDIHFSERELYELRIAAWLHDCGKVTTPEYVVDKATKLETIYDRIHTIATRMEVLKRDAEIRYLKQQLALEKQDGLSAEAKTAEKQRLRKNYQRRLQRLADDLTFLEVTNIGGEFMSPDKKDRVRKIAKYRWTQGGERLPFLDDNEISNLLIARGTLTHNERKVINNHITQTIKMLRKLPYPKHLANIPEFAGGHHEKMDGTGYPMGLTAKEMSIQARIMAIADIFEALTARDRPYKKGKTLSEAMRILGFMKNDAHIDPDLFNIFVKEKIHLEYAGEYLDPAQVDMES